MRCVIALALIIASGGVRTVLAPPAAAVAIAADPAKLALASRIVARLVPDGSYRAMIDPMIMAAIGSPDLSDAGKILTEVVWLTGQTRELLAALPPERVAQALAIFDPAFVERDRRLGQLKSEVAELTSERMEVAHRDGLAAAYAARFTTGQLEDIDRFLATLSGTAYAVEARRIEHDPTVTSRTAVALEMDVRAFDVAQRKAASLTLGLPPRRGPAELTADERAKVATLLGIAPAALK